jgi:hypothetical protein
VVAPVMWVIATSNENEANDSLGGIPHLNYISLHICNDVCAPTTHIYDGIYKGINM